MNKRWIIRDIPNKEKVEFISNRINTDKLISSLLVQRGIESFEGAKSFFRPSLNNLHNPFKLKDLEKAVNRIIKSIDEKEKILVYGDYDVDGTTAVAMMFSFLKSLDIDSNILFYIPDRYDEGYGVSEKGVNWAVENQIRLIITLDCGIRDCRTIELAYEQGIDVIISDHHEPGEILPKAYAIVNPKRRDCKYPFKGLSGCAVGFKIIQGIAIKKNIPNEYIFSYLDFVAVSIAADIVPLVGENRIFTHFGIKILEKNPRLGFKALKELIGLGENISVSEIVFKIAPRLNAPGRIDHAKLVVELLLSNDINHVSNLARIINEKNDERKYIDNDITSEAISMIESRSDMLESTTTFLYKKDWHKGIVGIVASRCIEKYYRPTIILTKSGNKATGSVRSVQGYNVYEALYSCRELLEKYGGHAFAAGLTLDLSEIEKFKEKFEKIVSDTIDVSLLEPSLEIDNLILIKDINWKMFNVIKQMSPFGPGNMMPIFATENVIATNYRILKEKHLKIYVTEIYTGCTTEAIGFNMVHHLDIIKERKLFKIAYKLQENNYLGDRKLGLVIKDIKSMED